MCGSLISSIFGGNRSQPTPPTPAPPTPPPAPQMVQRAPVEPPATPTIHWLVEVYPITVVGVASPSSPPP